MPWHPRVPTRWPSWNVPIFAVCAVIAGTGLLAFPDAYTSGTYHYAASLLGLRAWGLLLIAAGLLALVFVNPYVAGFLTAVIVAWFATLAGSVVGGYGATGAGPVWLGGVSVATGIAVLKRGATPE